MIRERVVTMSEPVFFLLAYVFFVNVFAFAAYGIDKSQARENGRRIPEATLLLLGLIGGSPAAFAAQRIFHHKTRKRAFQTAFWTVVFIQIGGLAALFLPESVMTQLLGMVHASPSSSP